jgi:DnaJ family protein C protein 17
MQLGFRMEKDFYQLLNVPFDATQKEIQRAYRIKALTCHPDKVGDDPVAAELFHQLSVAMDVLSNESLKREYDLKYKAHYAALERNKSMDSARRLAREKLEALEKQGLDQEAKRKIDLEILSKIQQEDERGMEFMLEQLRMTHAVPVSDRMDAVVRAKWDQTMEVDAELFSKYVPGIEKALMSASGKRRANLIFRRVDDAIAFMKSEKPYSLKNISFSWASGEPVLKVPDQSNNLKSVQPMQDYEYLTLKKMRERGIIISSNNRI